MYVVHADAPHLGIHVMRDDSSGTFQIIDNRNPGNGAVILPGRWKTMKKAKAIAEKKWG